MKRWIYVSDTVGHPAEWLWDAFRAYGRTVLATGEQGIHADGSFTTHVHVDGFPMAPRLRVNVGIGAHRPDGRVVVGLSWQSETTGFAFPQLDGAIEFEPLSSKVARVSVLGSYVPPFGVVGTVIDATVMRRAAEVTARTLLARLLDGLNSPATEVTPTSRRAGVVTVADVMTVDPFVIDADLPLKTAALLLFHLDLSGAPVVDADGELLGVLTERDLLDKEAARPHGMHALGGDTWRRRDALTAGQACSRPAHTTAPEVLLRDAAAEMRRLSIGRLVVTDPAGIVGIVTRHDVLVALLRGDAEVLRAANTVLLDLSEKHVRAYIEWGVARLSGHVSLRSKRDALIHAISDIDGVMAVDADELGWDVDDVASAVMA